MGARKVVITRSRRAGGAPTIASRWLQRLTTLAGEGTAPRVCGPPADLSRPCSPARRRAGRCRAGHPRDPARAAPAAGASAERLFDHRRRDADPRSLCDPCPQDHAPRAAAGTDARSACRRARQSLPRHSRRSSSSAAIDPDAADAEAKILAIARERFDEEMLPPDIEAVWWPRAEALCAKYHRLGARTRGPRRRPAMPRCGGRIDFTDLARPAWPVADRVDVMAGGVDRDPRLQDRHSPRFRRRVRCSPRNCRWKARWPSSAPSPARRHRGERLPTSSMSACANARSTRNSSQRRRTRGRADGSRRAQPTRPWRKFRGFVAHFRHRGDTLPSRTRPSSPAISPASTTIWPASQEWSIGTDEGGATAKGGGHEPVHRHRGDDAAPGLAADPRRSVFVSANAGSGKTHVLTERVVRLLLDGVEPRRSSA